MGWYLEKIKNKTFLEEIRENDEKKDHGDRALDLVIQITVLHLSEESRHPKSTVHLPDSPNITSKRLWPATAEQEEIKSKKT